MKATLEVLRRHAIGSSLFQPTTLKKAVERLGFVQADPIRSPARAQDLILRHRVKDYGAGDLEELYAKLDLEEDFLYAYGFMPHATWRLLHPRSDEKLTAAERRVLELVSKQTTTHPRELEAHLGRARQLNAWGGYSQATTRTLHALHYRGLLRVAGRENGIRVYEATDRAPKMLSPIENPERLKKLVLLIARILAPVPERSLRAALRHLAHAAPALQGRHSAVTALINSGELENATVDGLRYVWPASALIRKAGGDAVRFLAPFDPLVWDRRRFEHFWGWPYRFEAYTPKPKRKLGYYAMPLLWREDVIGWVNVSGKADGITVEAGFVKEQPREAKFRYEFEAEVQRLRAFLQKPKSVRKRR